MLAPTVLIMCRESCKQNITSSRDGITAVAERVKVVSAWCSLRMLPYVILGFVKWTGPCASQSLQAASSRQHQLSRLQAPFEKRHVASFSLLLYK